MTTLIESRSNRLGIEVRHETSERGAECVRAYQNGRAVAELRVERAFRSFGRPRRTVGGGVELLADLDREQEREVVAAIDEGVRVLRDGRGLCEVA